MNFAFNILKYQTSEIRLLRTKMKDRAFRAALLTFFSYRF